LTYPSIFKENSDLLAVNAADYSGKIQAPLHLLDLLQAQGDQVHIPDHFSVTPCFYRRQFRSASPEAVTG
jgi:hypothetical protein